MKTISKTVYQYSELGERSKEKAKNYYNEHLFCDECITEQLEQDLFAVGTEEYEFCFPNAKLSYSLSYCQGDGVSFTGIWEGNECLPILQKAYNGDIPKNVKRLIPWLSIELKRNSHHYSHEYTVNTNITLHGNYKYGEHLEKILYDIEKHVNSYRLSVCKTLENYGYTAIEDQLSDECLEDFYNNNEYWFDELGNIERGF